MNFDEWKVEMERGTRPYLADKMFEDWQREVEETKRALVQAFVDGAKWGAREQEVLFDVSLDRAGAEAEARRRLEQGTLGKEAGEGSNDQPHH